MAAVAVVEAGTPCDESSEKSKGGEAPLLDSHEAPSVHRAPPPFVTAATSLIFLTS